MKNKSKNLPAGTNMRRNAKKGSYTPCKGKKRSVARFYEIKIRLSTKDFLRGQPYFGTQKQITKYFLDAYTEKVNRAEANNKAARLRALAVNVELLEPIIKEMYAQGKLEFLRELIGGANG